MLPHMRRPLNQRSRALASFVAQLRNRRSRALLLVVLGLLGACDAGTPQADAPRAADPTPTSSAPAPAPSLEPSEPFDQAQVTLRSPDGATEVEVPVYVAADVRARGHGLMERDDLPDGTGMVFLFPGDTTGAFYMFNTRIPLSIAFYAADGEVVRVLDMAPCTAETATECELYPPGVDYRGALEVEQGYFDEIGLAESWTVELPSDLPSPS